MIEPLARFRCWSAVAVLAVASAGSLGCTTVDARPQQPETPGLTVTGEGSVRAEPDMAVVNIGVETRDASAERAVAENERRMRLLLANLKSLGVSEQDLQTSNFGISFERAREDEPPRPLPPPTTEAGVEGAESAPAEPAKPAGWFVVSNTLNTRVRQLERLGEVLGGATASGANSIWGIDFRIDDPSELERQARDRAIEDAFAKARRMAQVSGIRLGRLLSVEEAGAQGPGPVRFEASRLQMNAKVSVQSGDVEITQAVTLRFAIEPDGEAKTR